MVGNTVEHYRIVSVLGEGGMGIVYKGLDLKLERFVAIKILNSQALKQPHFVERFKLEARNQAKLIHHNIVPVYGFTEDVNVLGIVMEFVEGETLEHIIERKGRLEFLEALEIICQVLNGVSYAHRKGFIHRDLKPSNVILSTDGIAKIMDFGISKSMFDKGITKTGTKLGTILYMSPEQIKAQEPTPQSDIYAVGVTLYEMLSGKPPFDYENEFEIMDAHLKKNPPSLTEKNPQLPEVINSIISKAMNKNLTKRYQSCTEFLRDIEQLINRLSGKKVKSLKSKSSIKLDFKKIKKISISVTFVGLFAALLIYVSSVILDLWKSKRAEQNDISNLQNEGDPYKSNPTYIQRSIWHEVALPTSRSLASIKFIDASVGFACGSEGLFLRTVDGGKSWEEVDISADTDLMSVNFFDNRLGLIVGAAGKIFRTTDGGKSWLRSSVNYAETIFNSDLISDELWLAVGNNGIILKSKDLGQTWIKAYSPTSSLLYSIAHANEDRIFIISKDGDALVSSDKGMNWQRLKKFADNYLRDIYFIDERTGFAVGGEGGIYRTTDSGENWETIKSNTVSGLQAIAFTDEKSGYIISSRGEVLISSDVGNTWEVTSSGTFTTLTDIAVVSSNQVFIAGQNGKLLTSNK